MKKTWRIPVVMKTSGTIEIDAETLADAIEVAEEGDFEIPDEMLCAEGEFEVLYDAEKIRTLFNGGQSDQ